MKKGLGLTIIFAVVFMVSVSHGAQTNIDMDGDKNVGSDAFADNRLYNTQYANDVEGIIPNTLIGKIMSGYQGWFNCPGDNANKGWSHWSKNGVFGPGTCSIDLWPDMSELDPDEKFATSFEHSDGSTAYVFSSHLQKTVTRHFQWMKNYGLDGVFVQRFATRTFGQTNLNHIDTVLLSCRDAATRFGRVYALMYDLSRMKANQMNKVIDDFKHLVDDYNITQDPADRAYLHHKGKPIVAVWGIGFSDGREYTLDECMTLVQFLKNDPVYGGCTVMLGVPSYWRTLDRDCVSDPKVHEIIKAADIVSPWAVGRFGDTGTNWTTGVDNYTKNVWVPDMAWCQNEGIEYLPVVFPGFSWHNLKGTLFDRIPRRGGRFLWRQYYKALNDAGVNMLYQAMFDEVDEGTAIFKCTNNPPVGASPFLNFDDGNREQPDHYLWLVGEAGKMLRGEIPLTQTMPTRP